MDEKSNTIKRFVLIAKDITYVKNAQKEIESRMYDLEIFQKVSIGRELKMVELKKKVSDLEKQLGET